MKINYDRKTDILLIELSKNRIAYAEEAGPIIIHFTKSRKPVLLEILDGSDFLMALTKAELPLEFRLPRIV
ncbi:MAG: DUF2283 domain-containing protein [Nitrospirae bacterium]|nr:DUF2283 domain-containing protein [Nitrospirota bacterium]